MKKTLILSCFLLLAISSYSQQEKIKKIRITNKVLPYGKVINNDFSLSYFDKSRSENVIQDEYPNKFRIEINKEKTVMTIKALNFDLSENYDAQKNLKDLAFAPSNHGLNVTFLILNDNEMFGYYNNSNQLTGVEFNVNDGQKKHQVTMVFFQTNMSVELLSIYLDISQYTGSSFLKSYDFYFTDLTNSKMLME